MPMLGQMRATCGRGRRGRVSEASSDEGEGRIGEKGRTFSSIESSTRGDGAFFEVARTMPFVAEGRNDGKSQRDEQGAAHRPRRSRSAHMRCPREPRAAVPLLVAAREPLPRGPRHLLGGERGTASSPLMPRLVVPWPTAARACSIWTSLPDGEKVVSEKLCRRKRGRTTRRGRSEESALRGRAEGRDKGRTSSVRRSQVRSWLLLRCGVGGRRRGRGWRGR